MMRQILVLVCGMSEKKVHICYPIQYTLQFFGGAAALHGLCYITVTEDPAAQVHSLLQDTEHTRDVGHRTSGAAVQH